MVEQQEPAAVEDQDRQARQAGRPAGGPRPIASGSATEAPTPSAGVPGKAFMAGEEPRRPPEGHPLTTRPTMSRAQSISRNRSKNAGSGHAHHRPGDQPADRDADRRAPGRQDRAGDHRRRDPAGRDPAMACRSVAVLTAKLGDVPGRDRSRRAKSRRASARGSGSARRPRPGRSHRRTSPRNKPASPGTSPSRRGPVATGGKPIRQQPMSSWAEVATGERGRALDCQRRKDAGARRSPGWRHAAEVADRESRVEPDRVHGGVEDGSGGFVVAGHDVVGPPWPRSSAITLLALACPGRAGSRL